MIFAKIENDEVFTSCVELGDFAMQEVLSDDGFKPLNDEPEPPTVRGLQNAKRCYRDDGETISVYYEVIDNDPDIVAAEIERLKLDLAETDYQVTKAQEYNLVGVPVPYDMSAVHLERERLRERIRELENLLP